MSNNKDKAFNTELGTKATVHTEQESGEHIRRANEALCVIGEVVLKPVNSEALKYVGSAAFHVYQSETLGHLFVVSQTTTLGSCPEILASKALTNFRGSLMEFFGRKRQKQRSGFG